MTSNYFSLVRTDCLCCYCYFGQIPWAASTQQTTERWAWEMELLEKICQCSNMCDFLDVLILMMVDLHQMFPGIFLFGVLSFSLLGWKKRQECSSPKMACMIVFHQHSQMPPKTVNKSIPRGNLTTVIICTCRDGKWKHLSALAKQRGLILVVSNPPLDPRRDTSNGRWLTNRTVRKKGVCVNCLRVFLLGVQLCDLWVTQRWQWLWVTKAEAAEEAEGWSRASLNSCTGWLTAEEAPCQLSLLLLYSLSIH